MTAQDFLTGLPAKIAPEALVGLDTVFHFDLDKGGLKKTVKVADGKMEIADGLVGEAKCVVSASSDLLMKVIKREEKTFPHIVIIPQSEKRTWGATSDDGKRALAILDTIATLINIANKPSTPQTKSVWVRMPVA